MLGVVLFDTEVPSQPLALVVALLLGAACFTGLGLAAASLIRSAEGVSPVVNAIVLPMAFVSGSFGPTEDYPEFVQALAAVLPLSYLVDLLVAVALDGETLWSQWRPIAVARGLGGGRLPRRIALVPLGAEARGFLSSKPGTAPLR